MRILIAGGGQVAALIARRLIREHNEIVIVEQDEERCAQLSELLDAKVVRGNAASKIGPHGFLLSIWLFGHFVEPSAQSPRLIHLQYGSR
jgi:pyrroline-5-carboxylate reductase